jgi:hypothetical protein
MKIFVSKNGKQLGPLTRNQVKEHLAAGNIATTDYFWCDGLGEWKTLSEFEDQKHAAKPQVKRSKSSLSGWWANLDWEDFALGAVGAIPLVITGGFLLFAISENTTVEGENELYTSNPQSKVPVTDLGYPVNWETMTETEKDKWLKWRLEQGIPLRNPFAKPLVRPTEIKFKLANKHLEKALNGGPCETLKDVKYLAGLDVNWHEDGFEDLNQMPNLETLALGGNSSSLIDDNIAELCEQKLPNLDSLIVPRTPKITISSVKMVITAFPSVSEISVMGCPKISQEECEALEKIHTNLKIWGDWNLDFGE